MRHILIDEMVTFGFNGHIGVPVSLDGHCTSVLCLLHTHFVMADEMGIRS